MITRPTNSYHRHQFVAQSSEAQSITTSSTFSNKTSASLTAPVDGNYKVSWYAELAGNAVNVAAQAQVQIDSGSGDTEVGLFSRTVTGTVQTNVFSGSSGFFIIALIAAQALTAKLNFRRMSATGEAAIKRARLVIERI